MSLYYIHVCTYIINFTVCQALEFLHTYNCCSVPLSEYYNPDLSHRDSVIQGYAYKLGISLLNQWQKKYLVLYPNRLEWGDTILVRNEDSYQYFKPVLWFLEGMKSTKVQTLGTVT